MGGVKVRLLAGPYAGGLYEPDGVTPLELLSSFLPYRWTWTLFYEPGTDPAELQEWLHADLMTRLMVALQDGRGIRFLGHRWQNRPGDKDGGFAILEEITAEMQRAGAFKIFADDPDGDLVLAPDPGHGTATQPDSTGTDQSG